MKMKHVSVVRPMFRQYGHGLSLLGVPPVAVSANHHVQTPNAMPSPRVFKVR